MVDSASYTHERSLVLRSYLVGRTWTITAMQGYGYAEEDEAGSQLHVDGAAGRRPLLLLTGTTLAKAGGPSAILDIVSRLEMDGATCTRMDIPLDTEGDITPHSVYQAFREGRIDWRFKRFWPQGDLGEPGFYISTRGKRAAGRKTIRHRPVEIVVYDKKEDLESQDLVCEAPRRSRIELRLRGAEARRVSRSLAVAALDLPPDDAYVAQHVTNLFLSVLATKMRITTVPVRRPGCLPEDAPTHPAWAALLTLRTGLVVLPPKDAPEPAAAFRSNMATAWRLKSVVAGVFLARGEAGVRHLVREGLPRVRPLVERYIREHPDEAAQIADDELRLTNSDIEAGQRRPLVPIEPALPPEGASLVAPVDKPSPEPMLLLNPDGSVWGELQEVDPEEFFRGWLAEETSEVSSSDSNVSSTDHSGSNP